MAVQVAITGTAAGQAAAQAAIAQAVQNNSLASALQAAGSSLLLAAVSWPSVCTWLCLSQVLSVRAWQCSALDLSCEHCQKPFFTRNHHVASLARDKFCTAEPYPPQRLKRIMSVHRRADQWSVHRQQPTAPCASAGSCPLGTTKSGTSPSHTTCPSPRAQLCFPAVLLNSSRLCSCVSTSPRPLAGSRSCPAAIAPAVGTSTPAPPHLTTHARPKA